MFRLGKNEAQILLSAAEKGDLFTIRELTEKGMNINMTDFDGNTALHYAAANDRNEVVFFLLQNRANVDAVNNAKWTPIMQAARHGHVQSLSILLKFGADINKKNKYGLTPLMLASVNNQVAPVDQLLEAGAELDILTDTSLGQVNALIISSFYGNDPLVRFILDKRLNVNKVTSLTSLTALMYSAAGGNESTSKILINRGADINVSNASKLLADDIALICNKPDIAILLQKNATRFKSLANITDVINAVKENNFVLLEKILQTDSSKSHFYTNEGATPLIIASILGYVRIARLLLYFGASINSPDKRNGWSPLMMALYFRRTDMALFLVEEGADLSMVTPLGQNIGDFAHECYNIKILKLFILDQIERNSKNENVTTSSYENQTDSSRIRFNHFFSKISSRTKYDKQNLIQDKSCRKMNEDSSLEIIYDPVLPLTEAQPPDKGPLPYDTDFQKHFNNLTPPNMNKIAFSKSFVTEGLKILPGEPQPKIPTFFKIVERAKKLANSKNLSSHNLVPGAHKFDCTNLDERLHIKEEKQDSFVSQHSDRSKTSSNQTVTAKTNSHVSSEQTLQQYSKRRFSQDLNNLSLNSNFTLSIGDGKLETVLRKISLFEYAHLFEEHEIDVQTFLELTESDLNEMGIKTNEEKCRIFKAISSLKEKIV